MSSEEYLRKESPQEGRNVLTWVFPEDFFVEKVAFGLDLKERMLKTRGGHFSNQGFQDKNK